MAYDRLLCWDLGIPFRLVRRNDEMRLDPVIPRDVGERLHLDRESESTNLAIEQRLSVCFEALCLRYLRLVLRVRAVVTAVLLVFDVASSR
jgi:hypothetical protein